ncbi:MAG TPA: hypothetical protein PKE25_08910, partial [Novosphingobium sp.]|nr:hypothetical protein [Novosphingobium sp.]
MIDLTLSEDSQAIVDAAADLLARAAPVDRLRQHGGDTLPAAQLAQWGWFAMGVAAERDGFGLGAGEQALIW